MANPVNVKWTGPTTYEDGQPFTQTDFGGYNVEVNGTGLFSVPVAWKTDNTYSFPVAQLPGLKQGNNSIRMQTVASNGQVSEWTPAATFQYLSIPKAPSALTVV